VRLFFAIRFPESIQSELGVIQDGLRDVTLKGNFTRKNNLHLTLVFLGEVEAKRCLELHEILKGINLGPFEIEIDHQGSFEKRDGKIVWLGFKANPDLFALQKQLTRLLRDKEFEFEDSPYKPHVTLVRGSRTKNGQTALQLDFKPIRVPVSRISLMVSERIDGVLRYREIDGIDL